MYLFVKIIDINNIKLSRPIPIFLHKEVEVNLNWQCNEAQQCSV